MQVEEFFNIFLTELESNKELRGYYRFLNNKSLFGYRKAYFCQRLNYIFNNLDNKADKILDIGCGYGTTGIFLALNGYTVCGTTVEYYYDEISKRMDFWKQYGDISSFTVKYENLFDNPPAPITYDVIILQDVLHHLEPLNDAIKIIENTLTNKGKVIVCEENGNNVLNSLRLFIKRGNKKIINIYDEKLNKNILLGNENIKDLDTWIKEFNNSNLKLNTDNLEYIRLYPPFIYNEKNLNNIVNKEQNIWKQNAFLKKYFFHGINYTVDKI